MKLYWEYFNLSSLIKNVVKSVKLLVVKNGNILKVEEVEEVEEVEYIGIIPITMNYSGFHFSRPQ